MGVLAFLRSLERTLLQGLKKAHFSDSVLFAAGKRAAVLLRPSVQRGLRDEDFEGERRAPVGGDHVRKLASRTTAPLRTIPFEEVVLIDEAVGGRVALDAAD